MLFVYFLICRRDSCACAESSKREHPEGLRVRMWLYPWLTYLTMAGIVVVVGSMYFIDDTRSQLLFSLGSLAVVIAAYQLRKRRAAARPEVAPVGAAR